MPRAATSASITSGVRRGCATARAQLAGVRGRAPNVSGDEVAVLDEPQLAGLGIEEVEALGRDPHLDVVDVELARRGSSSRSSGRSSVRSGVGGLGLGLLDTSVGSTTLALVVDLLVDDPLGRAVELADPRRARSRPE